MKDPAKNVIVSTYSGEMDVKVKYPKGHKSFVFQYGLATAENVAAEDVNWVSIPSMAQCTLVKMPVGQQVLIHIGIAGTRKQLVYTTPVLKPVA